MISQERLAIALYAPLKIVQEQLPKIALYAPIMIAQERLAIAPLRFAQDCSRMEPSPRPTSGDLKGQTEQVTSAGNHTKS
jgi:hypothetical protein